MLTYAAELFYAPVHMHIVVHHLNTGAIVYSTLIVAHFTHDPRICALETSFRKVLAQMNLAQIASAPGSCCKRLRSRLHTSP